MALDQNVPWQRRVRTITVAATWTALALGITVSIFQTDASLLSLVATLAGGLWVLIVTSTQAAWMNRTVVREATSLVGSLLAALAIAVTGTSDSPFYLLSLTPALHSAATGGFRIGMATGGLSGALLLAVSLSQNQPLGKAIGLAALYLVMAATMAQIRRILMDLELRANTLAVTSQEAEDRLEQLESANSLLRRLADITSAGESRPVALGRRTLEALAERYKNAGLVAAIIGDHGPIVVARSGTPPPDGHEHRIPLTVADRTVGWVSLTSANRLEPSQLDTLEATLRPLALAFSNALMMQEIAGTAVREERSRLARELHDEIGPSVASLGLALDAALLTTVDERDVAEHLEQLRGQVTGVVEEVRTTVADLRSSRASSLIVHLARELARHPDSTERVNISIDERRPVRPSMADDVHAVVSEALRNAIIHANGTPISVNGWVDFDRGRIVVADRGSGFDVNGSYDGHFGLVGMRERASRAGLRLDVASSAGGTRVAVEWGHQ